MCGDAAWTAEDRIAALEQMVAELEQMMADIRWYCDQAEEKGADHVLMFIRSVVS